MIEEAPKKSLHEPKTAQVSSKAVQKNTKTTRDDPNADYGGPTQGPQAQNAILLPQNTHAGWPHAGVPRTKCDTVA